jgi:hypothetical protein
MSGVFSMASQAALQYLPDVTRHEHTGCSHFVNLASFNCLLLWRNSATFTFEPDPGEAGPGWPFNSTRI